jgi:hypothetical protein
MKKTPNKLAQMFHSKQYVDVKHNFDESQDLAFVLSKIVVTGIKGRGIYLKMYWMEEKENSNINGIQQSTSFSNLERINETKQQTDVNFNCEDSEFENSFTFVLPNTLGGTSLFILLNVF